MTKEEIRNELREILRVYHYESDTENNELDKWTNETNVTDNCVETNENEDLFELNTATVMSQ